MAWAARGAVPLRRGTARDEEEGMRKRERKIKREGEGKCCPEERERGSPVNGGSGGHRARAEVGAGPSGSDERKRGEGSEVAGGGLKV